MRWMCLAGCFITAASMTVAAYSQSADESAAASSITKGRGCSNQTVKGTWGTTIEGTILGPNLQFRGLALAYFDGNGHVTQVDHIVFDGVPPSQEWSPGSGTYTVNPDCTGSGVLSTPSNPTPVQTHFIIVENGKKIIQVVDGNAVMAIANRLN